MVEFNADHQGGKYDVKSIQVEPDNMFDVLKMSKGIVRLHTVYNEQFKKMNSQMDFIDEILAGQKYGNISNEVVYPQSSIDKIIKIWRGGAFVELENDHIRTNEITNYWIVFDEDKLDNDYRHYNLPALEELDPLTHVNDESHFLQMTEEIPNDLAYWKMDLNTINSQWYVPRYYSWDQIIESDTTTMTWGKPFFFSLIKQLRVIWNELYNEIRAYDHEIIKHTQMMGMDKKEFKIKAL